MKKPVAPSCERNRDPILEILIDAFHNRNEVLEIGSGTGEHGVYFARNMPWLIWQCSDVTENLLGINLWVSESHLSNLPQCIELDVSDPKISKKYDAIFSANTLHIMSESEVINFFKMVNKSSQQRCDLVIYGPFNYGGSFTSDSNAQFEIWLKNRDPLSGIRDFEWVNEMACENGFELIQDHDMPANNRCVHWRK